MNQGLACLVLVGRSTKDVEDMLSILEILKVKETSISSWLSLEDLEDTKHILEILKVAISLNKDYQVWGVTKINQLPKLWPPGHKPVPVPRLCHRCMHSPLGTTPVLHGNMYPSPSIPPTHK